jgi:hypothetical protein
MEILAYWMMDLILHCLYVSHFKLMHWWNLYQDACFLISLFWTFFGPLLLGWWCWHQINEILCDSRMDLPASAWRIRGEIFRLFWNHWWLMFKLFLIFVKSQRNQCLRCHWLLKTLYLLFHLLQLAFYFFNFSNCWCINTLRIRSLFILNFCYLLWLLNNFLYHNILFLLFRFCNLFYFHICIKEGIKSLFERKQRLCVYSFAENSFLLFVFSVSIIDLIHAIVEIKRSFTHRLDISVNIMLPWECLGPRSNIFPLPSW